MDRKISATFRTRQERHAVSASPILVPATCTPDDLSRLINHMRHDDPASFVFLLDGTILAKSLAEELAGRGLSPESSVTIDYMEMPSRPERERLDLHPEWIRSVRGGLQGGCLTGSYDTLVRFFGTSGPAKSGPIKEFRGHAKGVTDLAWIDQRHFVSASADKTLMVWDADLPAAIAVLHGHQDTVQAVAAGLGLIASGSWDGAVMLWDSLSTTTLSTGRKPTPAAQFSAHVDPISRVRFASDSLYTAGWDRALRRWDPSSQIQTASWLFEEMATCFAISVRSGLIAAGHASGRFQIIDPRSDVLQERRRLHDGWIGDVAWSPLCEHTVLTVGYDGSARVWDIRGLAGGPLYSLATSGPKLLAADWTTHGIYFGGEECLLHTLASPITSA